jgi:hypothetical protein
VKENRRSPLVSYGGIALIRDLISRLGIASDIDSQLSVMKRHKPYYESDHVLNLVYNFLTGGECLSDIERLQEAEGYMKILGTDSIPDPTTAGDFLVRFQAEDVADFQQLLDGIQEKAFSLMDKKRKELATVDHDSSIHEVYGKKKEGADYSYENTYSYNVQYVTLAETGDVLYQELREGNTYSSAGIKEVLPGIFERVGRHFHHLRFRADSASYDKDIIRSCDEGGAEFFISADQTKRLMKEVLSIEEEAWKSFHRRKLQGAKRKPIKKRRKRKNHKKAVLNRRKPHRRRKGKVQIASFFYQPRGWKKEYRFVVKRTEVLDASGQLYLEGGLFQYIYHVVVTNSNCSDSRVMSIAQGRANQENLIKDFKYGLGLSHVPTGFLLANKIYFKIAALAWNIKTWMLNLLKIGNGAVLRFKRFLYLWIFQACVVSRTAVNTLVLRMNPGDYFSRFSRALNTLASL